MPNKKMAERVVEERIMAGARKAAQMKLLQKVPRVTKRQSWLKDAMRGSEKSNKKAPKQRCLGAFF
jgi:hypothetical protein